MSQEPRDMLGLTYDADSEPVARRTMPPDRQRPLLNAVNLHPTTVRQLNQPAEVAPRSVPTKPRKVWKPGTRDSDNHPGIAETANRFANGDMSRAEWVSPTHVIVTLT